jgi:hypothetical protein
LFGNGCPGRMMGVEGPATADMFVIAEFLMQVQVRVRKDGLPE